MTGQKKAEINILGQRVGVRGEEGGLSADEIARFVEARIQEVQARERNLPPMQTLLRAYFELAAAYLTAKQRTVEYRDEMRRRLEILSQLLPEGAGSVPTEHGEEAMSPSPSGVSVELMSHDPKDSRV